MLMVEIIACVIYVVTSI